MSKHIEMMGTHLGCDIKRVSTSHPAVPPSVKETVTFEFIVTGPNGDQVIGPEDEAIGAFYALVRENDASESEKYSRGVPWTFVEIIAEHESHLWAKRTTIVPGSPPAPDGVSTEFFTQAPGGAEQIHLNEEAGSRYFLALLKTLFLEGKLKKKFAP